MNISNFEIPHKDVTDTWELSNGTQNPRVWGRFSSVTVTMKRKRSLSFTESELLR